MADEREREERGAWVREKRADGDGGGESAEPSPQPERGEPRVEDPGLRDLSASDYKAIVVRAGKGVMAKNLMDTAAALAYRLFTAIPALLLVLVGAFSVFASPQDVTSLMERLGGVVPGEAVTLIEDSLNRVVAEGGGGALIGIGALVALWTSTSAMTSLMRGLNLAFEVEETRNFLKQRLIALAMLGCMFAALALVFGLLVLGPLLSDVVGSALGLEDVFGWIWWTVQWPVLVGGLLLAFGAILYLAPNVEGRRLQFLTLGAAITALLWLLGSGLFALYVGNFGAYNETWGSLAAVIIMLTWLWLTSLALLLGGQINAEARRSGVLRERANGR